jgi:hypothetical protein
VTQPALIRGAMPEDTKASPFAAPASGSTPYPGVKVGSPRVSPPPGFAD